MKLSELEFFLESNKIDTNDKEIINLFLTSINDWPNTINSINEYIIDVEKFTNQILTEENINYFIKKLDISRYAWQAESLSQIIDVFKNYNKGITLNEIAIGLENKFKPDRSNVHNAR
jgi:hypothetical protein